MTAPTVGSVGMGATLGGGILSAFGSIAQGQSSKQMYDYQAQVAKINSQIATQNSDYALQVGGIQAQDEGIKQGQIAANIKDAQSSSGLDVNSGSATQVQTSQHTTAMMDLDQIRSNAAKTAYDYQTQAVEDTNQATLDTSAGANAETAGFIGAGSSILGTAGSVSSKWLQGNQVGLYSGSGSSFDNPTALQGSDFSF